MLLGPSSMCRSVIAMQISTALSYLAAGRPIAQVVTCLARLPCSDGDAEGCCKVLLAKP